MPQLGVCSPETGKRLISHFKAFAAMDVVQNRRPQDGRAVYSEAAGGQIDLRINTIPTLYGEDMTVRLLRRMHGKARICPRSACTARTSATCTTC